MHHYQAIDLLYVVVWQRKWRSALVVAAVVAVAAVAMQCHAAVLARRSLWLVTDMSDEDA